jgi:hypothetical protein
MKYVMYIILASVMLSGCAKTNSYYPRPYGEDWKVYPFVEGTATKVREQGRACWKNDPNNLQGLCY